MTLKTWVRLFIVGFAVVIIQVGVLQQIVIAGAHPDAFLLVAIAAGLVAGPQYGAVVGFVAGLVADLFVITPYGLSALCYVLVAFAVGYTSLLPGGRAPSVFGVVSTFVASFGGTLLYLGLAILVGQPHLARNQVLDVVFVVSVANAVLALPAIFVMRWVFATQAGSSRELATSGGFH